MLLEKLIKWGTSSLRVAAAKLRLGSRLRLHRGGKPVYLGHGVRLMVQPGGCMELGAGAYIDDRSRLQVNSGATMRVGDYVYMNTNVCVVAAECIEIGSHTMVGPNVCIYDHDHVFDTDGVHSELKTAPVHIGERCWLGSNAIVTSGVTIGNRILAGGGCVITHSLLEPGVYVGNPARFIRAVSQTGYGVDGAQEDHARGHASQVEQRAALTGDQEPSGEGAKSV